jgi:pantoate--beta-alanine ligase
MDRLLDIVRPGNLYMGQKDYQQCMVVKRLMSLMQLPASLHTCPTLREADGLAMSSRNIRLGPAARRNATAIFLTLNYIKDNIKTGGLANIITESTAILTKHDFKVDYVAIADAQTLELLDVWNGTQKIVALIAAFQHEVRLIDNMVLN